MKHTILLIDDDKSFRDSMSLFLKSEGFNVRALSSGDEAIALVRQQIVLFSVALVDYHMPETSGLETIWGLKDADSKLQIFAFSGDGSVIAHNKSLESGAAFFIDKTISDAKLLGLLHRACKEVESKIKPIKISPHSENQKLIETIGMVGVSESMAQTAKLIHKIAPTDETVLIRGDHGTGKEKIAKAVHNLSNRKNQPFIAVNCASIAPNLIESELFGHEKGSYTGAIKDRKGYFEAAQGGTIFLDEIGELPKHLQATLLRVLQEKSVTPVGSNESKKIDFRLVAATNAPLEQLMTEKLFREDLFFRLNVFAINIKPLNDRIEDVPLLAQFFVDLLNKNKSEKKILLAATGEKLKKISWTGNVRELESFIHILYQLSEEIIIDDSPIDKKTKSCTKPNTDSLEIVQTVKMLDEKNLISKAMTESGSISGVSRILNISRSTVRDKMKKYGIEFNQNDFEGVII